MMPAAKTPKANHRVGCQKADFVSAFFMGSIRRVAVALLGGSAAVLLSGCHRGPDAMMADYATRIARISEQPVEITLTESIAYPRSRDRRIPLPEIRARLLALTDFQRCNLTQLIAERNSILGRYWEATRRLDYEFRFSHRLARCQRWLIQQPDLDADDTALLEQLNSLSLIKAKTRPLAWWAATWAGDEFADYFSAAAPFPSVEAQAPIAAFTPLAAVAAQLDDPPDGINLPEIELALQNLRRVPYGGGWARATNRMTLTLHAAAGALNAVNTQRLCPQATPSPKARIFENVFYRQYAERLQPYLSALHRQGEAQLVALEPLLATMPRDAPDAFKAYAQRVLSSEPGSLWADMSTARHRHTEAWQRILRDCNLMPDGAGPPG